MVTRRVTRPFHPCGMLLLAGLTVLLSLAIAPTAFSGNLPDCNDPDTPSLCPNPTAAIIQDAQNAGYPYYVGHAEPTTLFFSTTGASGYNMQWKFQLPATDPTPSQDGASVANFELYSAFWIGLALCDPNSNPFGACTPLSDANNPSTAGAAFLELQFYPPGSAFGGCSDTQWCVRLHINTLQNATTFQKNNCLEPTTEQYVTADGTPGGTRILMSNGDSIVVTITDTASGLRTDVNDQTSATTGFMVASGANGFVHNANQTDCTTTAFDFHAMYATASPGQVVPWASLGPNVSFDFEIGHWELCAKGDCSTQSDQDSDDSDPTSCGTIRGVGGCIGSDTDHDGTSYLADWPDGTVGHPATLVLGSPDDRGVGPLTSSVSNLSTFDEGYNRIKFMTTESTTGAFYPFWSQAGTGSACRFNFGNDLPGTTTDFGKTAQYDTTIDNPCMPGTPPVALCKDQTVPTDLNVCVATAVSIDNGSNDPDGDPVTLSQAPAGPYGLGTTSVTLTVTEPEKISSFCTANITVVDQQKPNISCPVPTVECTGPSGASVTLNPTVTDNCPGILQSSCTPPSGATFPLGTTPFTCNAKDAAGNTNSCASAVNVVDTTPPIISAVSASPNSLWPPDHKFVPVQLAVSVSDTCDANVANSCLIVSITSSEPVLGAGSGKTSPDWQITGKLTANLRAERSGLGDGRTYTLTVRCTDASGNSATKATTVQVTHDQGHL